jgi:hypothetical protein
MFGASLSLHSGGVDLKFPHHNNEIAQVRFSVRVHQPQPCLFELARCSPENCVVLPFRASGLFVLSAGSDSASRAALFPAVRGAQLQPRVGKSLAAHRSVPFFLSPVSPL